MAIPVPSNTENITIRFKDGYEVSYKEAWLTPDYTWISWEKEHGIPFKAYRLAKHAPPTQNPKP